MGEIVNLGTSVPFNFWESRIFTDELLRAAADDPALWPEQAERIAKFDVNLRNGSLAWQEGAQLAIKQVGLASGVPSSMAATIGSSILDLSLSTPKNTNELAINLAQAGIGIVTNALSAIPIVGAIAGAIGGIAGLLFSLSKDKPSLAKELLPPLVDYSDEVDEFVVNDQVIPALATLDWTGLILPRYKGTWKAHEREHGWAVRQGAGGGGVGFMPGTQRITSTLQTYFIYKSVRKGFQLADSRDQGSFYPGAAQMLTAMLEQVAKPQTQLYNVDTHRVESKWRDHFLSATEFAIDVWEGKAGAIKGNGLSDLTTEQRRAVASSIMTPLHVNFQGAIGGIGTAGWTPWNQGVSVYDKYILPWCKTIRQRQKHFVDTIVGTAYTDESQAAFQGDQELLLKLRINRGLLMKSSARSKVSMADMIDPAYREQMFDVTIGDTFAIEAGPPMPPPETPDTIPRPPGGGAPFEGFGSKIRRRRSGVPYIIGGLGVLGATAASYRYWTELSKVAASARKRLPRK